MIIYVKNKGLIAMEQKNKIHPKPEIKEFKIKDIKPARYNPRTIDKNALAGLSKSLEKFGCVEPIIVNIRGKKNTIVGGHQRFKALKQASIKTVTCVTVDLNKTDEKLLNITLNNPEIQGEFIEDLEEYINKLRKQTKDDSVLLGLRIDQIRKEILGPEGLSDEFILPNNEKFPFQQITFTLSDKQAEIIKKALIKSRSMGEFKDDINKNRNGNALSRICKLFLEMEC
jgi:ParB-like nuclease family protein